MVNETLGKYSDSLQTVQLGDVEASKRAVELFFSFDIVNSSSYKDVSSWDYILKRVLEDIQKNVTKNLPEAQLWRVLGDEIIFFVTISDEKEIEDVIESVFSVLNASNLSLENGSFFGGFDKDIQLNAEKRNTILAVQAAAWLAIVFNGDKSKVQPYDNLFTKYNISETQKINDFLGPDIDIGFRIKKETQARRLVVSVELARLLIDKSDCLSRLNIITYKKLNGVWRGALYPIIWYHNEKVACVSFEDSFYYDEVDTSELTREYFDNMHGSKLGLSRYMFTDIYKALIKITGDRRIDRKIEAIRKVIEETGKDYKNVESEFETKLLEFHCAAVCCDIENQQVLIAKRKERSENNNLNNLWEFGCAKADTEQALVESIKNDYFNDFGLEIEVICDKCRQDSSPIPIALYQVKKSDKIQKGVIVVARIVKGLEKIGQVVESSNKHSEYRFITSNEIKNYSAQAVSDFSNTLSIVFEKWDEFFFQK